MAMEMTRHFVEKPWGRIDIPDAFRAPAGQRIGEIWYETHDDAPLPLLVKWLFTSEKLSIQVHPSNAQAEARGLPSGKEECWYVVDAEPDARIGIGTLRPLDAEELRAASLSGDIESLMDWKAVVPGSFFYIPAGTVHAIGAGVTLVEVQQYADITYRLYDYGRPRELHLDDGVAVSAATPYTDARSGVAQGNAELVKSEFFKLWLVADENGLKNIPDNCLRWWVPLSGDTLGSCTLVAAHCPIPFVEKMLVAAV
jgi:mannose-6-phosphate isomerase